MTRNKIPELLDSPKTYLEGVRRFFQIWKIPSRCLPALEAQVGYFDLFYFYFYF